MAKDGNKPPVAEKRSSGRQKFDFPKNTLEDSLRVAQAIEDANAGQPYPPNEAAFAMNLTPGRDEFRDLISSSFRYGLTKGTYATPRVSLEPLGRSIVQAQSQEEVSQSLVKAALTPDVFRRMYEYFRGKKLPESRFLPNTAIREFHIPKEQAERCVTNFVANMEFVGFIRTVPTGKWVRTEASLDAPALTSSPEQSAEMNEAEVEEEMINTGIRHPESQKLPASPPVKNAIFVGHGKNKVPLEQLKSILNQYAIPHKIAIGEPNVFRPISQKVAETMQECGAGILIFTADEEFRDKDGNIIWRPSENVVYELGASAVLYGQKVIIFKEKSVDFPSNFKDIGYIEFEKDALGSKTNELFKELIEFGLIKVTVGA